MNEVYMINFFLNFLVFQFCMNIIICNKLVIKSDLTKIIFDKLFYINYAINIYHLLFYYLNIILICNEHYMRVLFNI